MSGVLESRFRLMRVVVFFDMPMETSLERRIYRQFRKFLIKDGYLMLQKSVYTKLSQNGNTAKLIIERLRKNAPSCGLVQVMTVTEDTFTNIEIISGNTYENTCLNTTKEFIEL